MLVLDGIYLIFDVLYLIGCALVGITIFLFYYGGEEGSKLATGAHVLCN